MLEFELKHDGGTQTIGSPILMQFKMMPAASVDSSGSSKSQAPVNISPGVKPMNNNSEEEKQGHIQISSSSSYSRSFKESKNIVQRLEKIAANEEKR